MFDWRGAVARELHHSEGVYLSRLGAVMKVRLTLRHSQRHFHAFKCLPVVLKVYHEPLTAALNSSRAILSFADIHTVLSPVAQILELNRSTNTRTNSDDTEFVLRVTDYLVFRLPQGVSG